MSKKDVFISYKTEEFDEANWVKTTLETNGISCWMAPMCIPGGSSYALEIPQAIRECKVFVLILSQKSQESKWVPRELDQAINDGKTVLPFMLENCPLKDDFNFYLTNVQRYAAYESKTLAMERMIKEIKALIGIEEEEPTPVLKPEEVAEKKEEKKEIKVKAPKTKKKMPKWPFIVGAAVLAFFIAVGSLIGVAIGKRKSNQIAGQLVLKKTESYMRLEDAELSTKDIETLKRFDNYGTVIFRNCVFPTNDLAGVFDGVEYTLVLENCGLTDAHIASLGLENKNIASLDLSNNKGITDISFVSGMKETMTEINISNTGVTDISLLADFTNLRELYMDGLSVSQMPQFTKADDLRVVSVKDNELSDLKGLESAIRLEEIYASGNGLTALIGLENTTKLKIADFSDNELLEIDEIKKNTELTELYLKNNSIFSLSALSDTEGLKKLDVSNNLLASIDPIEKNTKLTMLCASDNVITGVEALENMKELSYIDFTNNYLMDVSALKGNENITYATLKLANNRLTEFVLPLGSYSVVEIYGNAITDISSLASRKMSTVALDYNEQCDYAALKTDGVYNIYLFNCPLDKQVEISETVGSYRIEYISVEEYLQK